MTGDAGPAAWSTHEPPWLEKLAELAGLDPAEPHRPRTAEDGDQLADRLNEQAGLVDAGRIAALFSPASIVDTTPAEVGDPEYVDVDAQPHPLVCGVCGKRFRDHLHAEAHRAVTDYDDAARARHEARRPRQPAPAQ